MTARRLMHLPSNTAYLGWVLERKKSKKERKDPQVHALVTDRQVVPLKDGIVMKNDMAKSVWDGFKSEDWKKKGGELNIYFTLHTKINSKSKKKLRARTVSSKLLEENMGINLQKVKIFKNQRTWQNILQVHRSMDLELGQRWPRILTAMLMWCPGVSTRKEGSQG